MRHYETHHCENFRTFAGQARKDEIEQLKSSFGKRTSFFKNRKGENVANTIASCEVSKRIAQEMKPFTDVDKNTDLSDTAQLAVFVRGMTSTFQIFIQLIHVKRTVTGADIIEALLEMISEMKFDFSKLIGITTDGVLTKAEYGDLAYFYDVRWLSRGSMLKRVLASHKELAIFLESKRVDSSHFRNPNWFATVAFIVDIVTHLNNLNLQLQRRKPQDSEVFVNIIQDLRNEFASRFADFKLFATPLDVEVETVSECFQMELIHMHCDDLLRTKFHSKDVSLIDFYAKYIFPSGKYTKSDHIEDVRMQRLKTTNFSIQIDERIIIDSIICGFSGCNTARFS
ncbi:transcription factor II-I repeat domain-containing 2-like [Octopus vulgaris]|uniref:Transcription factor II-I repeat domain-containing 2-like n=1 Tax=Octopus vulgaris TaxID=6645 RepID=A0AA36AFP7_OCTVU|nr:transcription factor II-I repeat domain-containing 2-like [Octopus vulgaris]